MEDYIDIIKKYRILIVLYVVIFIFIIYFIWRPKSAEEVSLFTINDVSDDTTYDYYYSYYKNKLNKIFTEANYEEIYNNYLLDEYKSKNQIFIENAEELLKSRCQGFASSSITKYNVSTTGNIVVYEVSYVNNDATNLMYIYEYSPYNFKIAFGKNVYDPESSTEDIEQNVDKDNIITNNNDTGLSFEVVKSSEYSNFVQYDVKVVNNGDNVCILNLIQNSNVVLVDSNGKYYMGSISKNDSVTLEKDNYINFSISFKINMDTLSTMKYLRFLKVEIGEENKQVDVKIN